MEKEFVNYSEALALKELGFDEPCMRGWYKDGRIWYHPDSDIILDNPTFSQAFKFFRENYEIHSYIERLISGAFIYKIDWFEEDRHNKIVWECKSYSFEKAELECLKKLIEIAQKRI